MTAGIPIRGRQPAPTGEATAATGEATAVTGEATAAQRSEAERIEAQPFGTLPDGRVVTRQVLRTTSATAAILDYGATLQSLTVPDRTGRPADVVLGMADLPGYQAQTAYLGAVIGRFANRIAGGRFRLNGTGYELACNDGPNNLHGGPEGFDRRLWTAEPVAGPWPQLRLRLTSPDGDQGFPGRLEVTVDYLLEEAVAGAPRLWIRYAARNAEPAGGPSTPVNLTHHAYFNLAGEGTGSVDAQLVRVPASRYTPVDADLIPFGEHADVAGTPFDLRTLTPLGPRTRLQHQQILRARGFDHNWVIDTDSPQLGIRWPGSVPAEGVPGTGSSATGTDGSATSSPGAAIHGDGAPPGEPPLRLALQAIDPGSGRRLEVWSDRPGVQLYTCNALDGTLVGASGRIYRPGDGFTAETQGFPDAPNQPGFPSTALAPQQTFRSVTVFAFGTD